MKYKMCVWDLDGTLLNTLYTLHYYDNLALVKYNFNPITIEESKDLIKHSIEDYYSILLELGKCPKDKIPNIVDEFTKYDLGLYLNDFIYKTEEFPEIREVINYFNNHGVINAVLTNKPDHIAKRLVKEFYNDDIKYVFGQSNNTPKPHKGCVDELIKASNIKEDEMIIVGDTEVDILTATNNNIKSVAVKWGYQKLDVLKSYNPTYIIDTPKELIKIFEE